MNFLNVSAEEIKEAKSGGMPNFKDNEPVRFLVEEAKEDAQNEKLIFGMQVIGGEHDGKKMPQYIDNSVMGKKKYIAIMSSYFTEQQLINGEAKPQAMVGKKVDTVAKLGKGKGANAGKTYTNFYTWMPVSDVPDALGEAVADSISKIEDEASSGDDLF